MLQYFSYRFIKVETVILLKLILQKKWYYNFWFAICRVVHFLCVFNSDSYLIEIFIY
jgi:hypothetical protein